MMQEAGNSLLDIKILSIQSQLGGLSFYCKRDKKYSFRQLRSGDDLISVIKKELTGENYNVVNYYHNSSDYVMIPLPLFDENMSDAYLLAKDIEVSGNDIITTYATEELVFVSMIRREVYEQLNEIVSEFNVLPIIARCYSYCRNYDRDILSYAIENDQLHICYAENKMVKFCETLPLTSASDFEFFTETLIKKYKPGKDFKIISLYENGEYVVDQKLVTKYRITKLLQENYFEI